MDDKSNDPNEAIRKLEALTLVVAKLTRHLGHGRGAGCTGWQAAWCPIHGDCTCEKTFGRKDTAQCPLHGEKHYTDRSEEPQTVLGTIQKRQGRNFPIKVEHSSAYKQGKSPYGN